MKVVYEHEVGGDGGKAGLYVEGSDLAVKVSYPIAKLLEPALAKLDPLDAYIKGLIPGNLEDKFVDDLVAGIKAQVIKLLTE